MAFLKDLFFCLYPFLAGSWCLLCLVGIENLAGKIIFGPLFLWVALGLLVNAVLSARKRGFVHECVREISEERVDAAREYWAKIDKEAKKKRRL